jgi:DNA-binding NarL/FixJ family response regulator
MPPQTTSLPLDRPTELEAFTLQQLADGKTIRQIADGEYVTNHAISMRLRRMADRLALAPGTTTGLVATALRSGWIT